MARFKKGELSVEAYRILKWDIDGLVLNDKYKECNDEKLRLIMGNLEDIFGKRIVKQAQKEEREGGGED